MSQPDDYGRFAVNAQEGDRDSMLELYRRALSLRRRLGLGEGRFAWNSAHAPAAGLLAFDVAGSGEDTVTVLINMSAAPVELEPLPANTRPLLESQAGACRGGLLAADSAAWLIA